MIGCRVMGLAVIVDNWPSDELSAFGAALEHRKPDPIEGDSAP